MGQFPKGQQRENKSKDTKLNQYLEPVAMQPQKKGFLRRFFHKLNQGHYCLCATCAPTAPEKAVSPRPVPGVLVDRKPAVVVEKISSEKVEATDDQGPDQRQPHWDVF